ncbi:MAG: metallophosphoesterase [Gammaproteobacteria bacterium]|nr:metallophosphoesterase [Gammaproteobacteria bacterium]
MRPRAASSSFCLAALVIAALSLPAAAAVLERGPYLQQTTTDSVIVRWRTDVVTDGIVRYGTDLAALDQTASENMATTEHAVTVSGLAPNTQYFYSIGDLAETLAGGDSTFTFKTSPATGAVEPTRIWVVGDSGTADANARAVRDAYLGYSMAQPADLWLMLGDNAYEDGTDAEYQAAVFDTYPTILRNTPLWPTLGNHDGKSADSATEQGPYYDIFTLPRNAEAGGLASGTEAYFSFDYANIHFITLDSYDTDTSVGGAMLTWLENDLAATSQDWLIAFWHHPPYTKGSHDSDSEGKLIDMRERVLPILESYGVDLVLSGHSHSYERSFLIDGHYDTSDTFASSMQIDSGSGREDDTGAYNKATIGAANQGTVYAVAGSSGKTGNGSLDHPVMFFSMQILGSLILDVSGNRLDAAFVDDLGARTDYFTITKGSATADAEAPGAVSGLAATNITETSLNLSWQAATDNVAVTGYRVSRDGNVVADADMLSYADSGLAEGTSYDYSVIAYDSAGNESAPATLTATTDEAPVANPPPPGGGDTGSPRTSGSGAITPLLLLLLATALLARRFSTRPRAGLLAVLIVFSTPMLVYAHEDVKLQLETVGAKIEHSPGDYRLFMRRGRLLGLHGEWAEAASAYRKAQELAPPDAAAFVNLGIGDALDSAGEAQEALPYLSRFLARYPGSSNGWRTKGRVLANLGNTASAVTCLDRAIRFANPPTPELFFERAQLQIDDGASTDEVMAGIDEGVATLGPLISLLELAVDLEENRGHFAAVVKRIENMPAALKDRPRWLHRRALALEQQHRYQDALQLNRLALSRIDGLPAGRRNSPAFQALRSRVEQAHARLAANNSELISRLAGGLLRR